MRWTALAAATALCATAIAADGGRGVTMMAAVGLASVVSSIAGFAFSAICGAMLFHISNDPVRIVQLMVVCSIANQATMTWSLRRSIDWPALVPYVAGGLATVPMGVWVLMHVERTMYTHLIGGLLVAYGLYVLFRKPRVIRFAHPALHAAIGALGGLVGGASGFPSASITIWGGLKGWSKERQRALYQPFILILQLATLLTIGIAGGTGHAAFSWPSLLFVPAGLLGTSVGVALYRQLSDLQFGQAVSVLMIIAGLSYA